MFRYFTNLIRILLAQSMLCLLATACSPSTLAPPTAPNVPLPSPVSPIAMHFPEAPSVCQDAFTTPAISGSLTGPGMYLLNTRYEGNQWVPVNFPHQAQSAQEVKTLVCILEDRQFVGQYLPTGGAPGGGAGYKITWEVRLVNWPEGKVLRANTLKGGEPPKYKSGSGDAYSTKPNTALGEWLVSIWGDTSVLFVCSTGVESIAFSPDGKTLTSGCRHGSVGLWDMGTGHLTQFLGMHDGDLYAVAFSPDGKTVASAGNEGTVNLWTWKAGQEVYDEAEVRTLAEHQGGVASLAFSPDGKMLATGGEQDGLIIFWNVVTGQKVRTLGEEKWLAAVSRLAFSSDGTKLVSSRDNTATLWNVATGQAVRTLTGHTDQPLRVALSPDEKTIAMASWDRTVKLWDAATGREVRSLGGHSDRVQDVAFSPDGKLLASGGDDKAVRLWNVATGQLVQNFSGHTDRVNSVAFAPDGKILASASADGTVKLWNLANR